MMKPKEFTKELHRQAASFRSLSKLLRTGEPNSKQLMEAAVAEGLAEVCESMAALKEVSAS